MSNMIWEERQGGQKGSGATHLLAHGDAHLPQGLEATVRLGRQR
jgi:hypothetical protein